MVIWNGARKSNVPRVPDTKINPSRSLGPTAISYEQFLHASFLLASSNPVKTVCTNVVSIATNMPAIRGRKG